MLPEPITTITTSILTNIASDIVEHHAKDLENTLAGKLLKWGGLVGPDFQDRLRDTIKKALQLFFQTYPQYNFVSIELFFRDPIVTSQIGSYILDRKPLDEQQIKQALNKHLMNDPTTVLLMRQRKVVPDNIIPDFLKCYRKVLSMQLSVSEMSLLLEMLDQNDALLTEIRNSETRMKEYIAELLKTKLSPVSLQAASQTSQQQGAADLFAAMNTAKLVQSTEAIQTLQTRIQSLPALFSIGLCKGRIPKVAPQQYFVSHGFQPDVLVDWRETLTAVLAQANTSQEPLHPYFSGDTLLGGYHFCGICEKLYATRFSIFLLPPTQDRNVYLELGIALGMEAPFLLIQPKETMIPPILDGLSRYVTSGTFRTIRRELPGKLGKLEEYDFGVVRMDTKQTQAQQDSSQYLIASGGLIDDEDVDGSIIDTLQAKYPTLQAATLAQQIEAAGSGWTIEQLISTIRDTRFAIYRVNEKCSPTTFLALGISIALNRPFLMIQEAGSDVPNDLRGIGMYQFPNFVTLEKKLIPQHQAFFDAYAQ